MNLASIQKTKTQPTATQTVAALVTAPKPATKRSSRLAKIGSAFARWAKGPDLTLEQWAMIERAHEPTSSHQRYSYLWNRGW